MKDAQGDPAPPTWNDPRTLAIDVGGSGLKASVLDGAGRMLVKRARVATRYPCRPEILLRSIADLAAPLPSFDRISIGFPGVIRGGNVITAPHFDGEAWRNYPLEAALSRHLRKPARLLNDAEVQGLGIIDGRGLEVTLTLGTGVGSAVFDDGRLAPHLELAQHPVHKGKTYNEYIGDEARLAISVKKWNRRVLRIIGIVNSLLHYDVLYIGGGNSANIVVDLPAGVRLASNDAGITGGVRLWDDEVWHVVRRDSVRGDRDDAGGRSAGSTRR
jgi:polyphosphate glucokinase